MPKTSLDLLDEVLDVLDDLATPDDRERLAELRQRVDARSLRVLVAGEAKRGKSTLVNQMIGRDVLPTGVTPVTAVVTTVRRAVADEHIVVTFQDGRVARHDLAELANFVSERGNPLNERGVRTVEVLVRSDLLDRFDVELVDTPGTGSVFEHNTVAAEEALASLDAAIFVVTADPPIAAAERDLLDRTSALSVRTFVVLNKADQLDEAGLGEAEAFTAQVVAEAIGVGAGLFPCSARQGRSDGGYARFADAMERYLGERADADLAIALREHAARLAGAMLDAAVLTERSLHLAASSSAERVTLFRDRLQAITARQRDIDDRCWVAERRMRRELDTSAARTTVTVRDSCRREVLAALDGQLHDLEPVAVETQGRALVIQVISEQVDRWRDDRAHDLEAGLASLLDVAAADLAAQLTDLRIAARDLLDVELAVNPGVALLLPGREFWYDFDPRVGFGPPLPDVARKALPGKAKRARTWLLDEIPQLADRQVGRARADLQQRLQESVRTAVAQLRRQHNDTLGRVGAALDDADAISETAAEEQELRRADLAARTTALNGVSARLMDAAR
ncbi:MAG TPA: dynamin family protein [Dermatophilaceae bacterium]